MSRELRCTAGHVVGVMEADACLITVQHKGRIICAEGVAYIRCECGALWLPGGGLPLADLEYKTPTLAGGR